MKKWWKSKTIWLGVVAAIIGGIEAFVRLNGGVVPPVVYEMEIIAAGIIGIILRIITNQGISR